MASYAWVNVNKKPWLCFPYAEAGHRKNINDFNCNSTNVFRELGPDETIITDDEDRSKVSHHKLWMAHTATRLWCTVRLQSRQYWHGQKLTVNQYVVKASPPTSYSEGSGSDTWDGLAPVCKYACSKTDIRTIRCVTMSHTYVTTSHFRAS